MLETCVTFDRATQSLGALQAAAYRFIAIGTCQINAEGDRLICHLVAAQSPKAIRLATPRDLQERFLNLVTDENLREKIARETNHIRDLVMSLAFGALAQEDSSRR